MNKDEQFRNNLRWVCASGAITRYPRKTISDRLQTVLVCIVYGAAVGFLIGFLVGMNL